MRREVIKTGHEMTLQGSSRGGTGGSAEKE